jgi:hypothetical protein
VTGHDQDPCHRADQSEASHDQEPPKGRLHTSTL